VFLYGMDIGAVSQELMRALKHEKTVVNKRSAFTGQEYRRLYLFMHVCGLLQQPTPVSILFQSTLLPAPSDKSHV
jgi:hypothetical protein